MAVLQYKTISNRTVAALSVKRDTVFWDRELKGFGVRVYPSGGKLYLAQARGLDGPDGAAQGEADHGRTPPGARRRRGSPASRAHHLADQGLGEAGAAAGPGEGRRWPDGAPTYWAGESI